MEYYSAIKKKKVLLFVTLWMDLENIMLSEISQSEKDKYHMIALIWGIYEQNVTSFLNSYALRSEEVLSPFLQILSWVTCNFVKSIIQKT